MGIVEFNSNGCTCTQQHGKSARHILNYQLDLIDKAHRSELRMQNNVKQRFRNKYVPNVPSVARKGSDIRMYETHTPGFCYSSDGTVKSNYSSSSLSTDDDIQKVADMLFTNGELDTNKILCLHLLGTHPCECLRPPGKPSRALSFLAREQSPLERLIERSRKRNSQKELKIQDKLPTYVLNLRKERSTQKQSSKFTGPRRECLIRDGRLATRLLINDNVTHLIQAVLEALERSNPTKMTELLATAKNPQKLREIVSSPDVQTFINSLSGRSLLSSCESFHLSQPFKSSVQLDVRHPPSDLDRLVSEIRHNVLRIPKEPKRNSTVLDRHSGPRRSSLLNPDRLEGFMSYTASLNRKGLFNIEKLAKMLNDRMREANERDMKEYKKILDEERSTARVSRTPSRKSLCLACNEKWKQPLPHPKTSFSRRNKVVGVDPSLLKCFLSKSTYMINMMIKDEVEEMDRREKRKRKEEFERREKEYKDRTRSLSRTRPNETTRRCSYMMRKAKNYALYYGYKPSESPGLLNNLNLAKIKNQISVTENVKKVKKFLEEPLLKKRS